MRLVKYERGEGRVQLRALVIMLRTYACASSYEPVRVCIRMHESELSLRGARVVFGPGERRDWTASGRRLQGIGRSQRRAE